MQRLELMACYAASRDAGAACTTDGCYGSSSYGGRCACAPVRQKQNGQATSMATCIASRLCLRLAASRSRRGVRVARSSSVRERATAGRGEQLGDATKSGSRPGKHTLLRRPLAASAPGCKPPARAVAAMASPGKHVASRSGVDPDKTLIKAKPVTSQNRVLGARRRLRRSRVPAPARAGAAAARGKRRALRRAAFEAARP
jgi:hypothetical protein